MSGKAHDQSFVFGAFIFLEQFPRSGYRNMCQQRQLDKRGEPEEERSAGWDNAERTKQVIQSIVFCFTTAGYQKTAGKQSVCTVFPRTLGTVTGCGIARNQPNPADPLDVLAKLGGFDIAGLCGVFLGGALEGVPILMDGFISSVAALCAVRLCPAAAKAVFASHVSAEPAAHMVLDALGKAPLITANLHLGEGTGAVASIPLWDMALAVYRGCYSFAEGGIAPYTPQC